MPLLREVIDIPERTGTSDFMLADSVTDSGATLKAYAVRRLLAYFDEALGLIRSAIEGGTPPRPSTLTGSFGSGKSHFTAVLHALLRGDQAARGGTSSFRC